MAVIVNRTLELIALAKDGDMNAREQVAAENLGLVWSVAKRFANRGHDLEDLYQIGCIGLLKSIDKFDLQYDVKFSTYAVPMIMGEIRRFLRDDNYIKVSRSMKELAYKINQLKDSMLKERGEEPGIEQLAEALSVEKEEIVFAMESAREVESIYNTVSRTNGDELLLIDRIQSKEDSSNEIVQHVTVEQLLKRLPEKEKKIIELRYYEDKTQAQIGALLGISQVQVSRIEKRILKWMREELEN